LLSVVCGADTVARLGGDEFVVVYEPNDPSSDNLIERIAAALSTPIDITADIAVSCPASIGTADTRTIGRDAAELLAAADAAMYEQKRARHARQRP
jgi:diguanylate cyclase (GGDEF)-like protein